MNTQKEAQGSVLRPVHGGRLDEAAKRWGIPRADWLDLSTGVNPIGWPVPAVPPEVWQRLPEDTDGLNALMRNWSRAPAAAACLPVSGSQAAIQTLPKLRRRCRVGVPMPGYQEHAHCWQRAGHELVPVAIDRITADDTWLDELDVLVWINPNNPTGTTVPPERLLAWHQRLQQRQGWLIVDEAFIDGTADLTLAPHVGRLGLVVLRSLGKFFGLAGVRAGAVLTEPDLAQRLDNELGPWSMSGPARFVMAQALKDTPWQTMTRERLKQDSARLHQVLSQHGLPASTGTLLFRYVSHPAADAIADHLAQQGILVRRFETPSALRFGLPGTETDWGRLNLALAGMPKPIDP